MGGTSSILYFIISDECWYLRFFLITLTLIFLVWRHAKKQIKNELMTFPIIGIPDKDKVDILLALFAIRCLEMYQIHRRVVYYQREAKEGCWTEPFIEEVLSLEHSESNGPFGKSPSKKQEKKFKDIAKYITENKFKGTLFSYFDSDTVDAKLALIGHHGIYKSDCFKSVKKYGFLEKTISELIEEYEILESIRTDTYICKGFINSMNNKNARNAEKKISLIWDNIILALRASLVWLESKKDTKMNVKQILQQVEALEDFEFWNLDSLLSSKNSEERYGPTPREEEIKTLLQAYEEYKLF